MFQNPKIKIRPFQSTLLVRGATLELEKFEKYVDISIHAPRERSDTQIANLFVQNLIFQSTLLVRGATSLSMSYQDSKTISIHAPRERSDQT